MSIERLPSGDYFVPGRNGRPGRSMSRKADAQQYDRDLDACCAPEQTAPDTETTIDAADYLADVVEAYLEALQSGVMYAEMELRRACDAYRATRREQT